MSSLPTKLSTFAQEDLVGFRGRRLTISRPLYCFVGKIDIFVDKVVISVDKVDIVVGKVDIFAGKVDIFVGKVDGFRV